MEAAHAGRAGGAVQGTMLHFYFHFRFFQGSLAVFREIFLMKLRCAWKQRLQASFGETIVESLGWAYENFATAYLGEVQTVWGLGAAMANIQATGRGIGACWRSADVAAIVVLKKKGRNSDVEAA